MIRKDSVIHNNNDSSSSSIFRAKVITVVGLVLVIAGIIGTIYYGSQFVREVDPNMNPPYTTAPQIKNTIPLELEIALVVVTILGFGILSFGVVAYKFDKPLDFYPV